MASVGGDVAGGDWDDFGVGILGSRTTKRVYMQFHKCLSKDVKAGELNKAEEVLDVVLPSLRPSQSPRNKRLPHPHAIPTSCALSGSSLRLPWSRGFETATLGRTHLAVSNSTTARLHIPEGWIVGQVPRSTPSASNGTAKQAEPHKPRSMRLDANQFEALSRRLPGCRR